MRVPILNGRFFVYDTSRQNRAMLNTASSKDQSTRDAQYSSSSRKIPGLPNNRTNEMIRGCEIRSIFGERPPPRPFHDDPVERRIVVHGFRW